MILKKRGFGFLDMQLLTYLLALPALAQLAPGTGRISGAVKDPDQAAVSGSRVTLTNQQTKARVTAVTDSQGAYTFASVPTGAKAAAA